MRPYTTPSLYHFVGRRDPTNHDANVATLCKILRCGWITHPPHNPAPSGRFVLFRQSLDKTLLKGELVNPNMVCFCDIHAESLGIHMQKYGRVGLSICHEYLVRLRARPVTYYPHVPGSWPEESNGLEETECVFRRIVQAVQQDMDAIRDAIGTVGWNGDSQSRSHLLFQAQNILGLSYLSFLKPYNPTLPLDDPDNYYMEREWRHIGNVPFGPEVVGNIVAPLPFVDVLRRDFPDFASKIVDTDSHANPT